MGVLITIEGVDGSGKTTQVDLLYKRLHDLGYSVIRTREPGGTKIGDQIRSLLLSKGLGKIHPMTELMLFQASRVQLVEEVIRPALREEKVVLCDRYIDSTLAYQGYGREMGTTLIGKMNYAVARGAFPKLTLILDLDIKVGLARASHRNKSKGLNETRFDEEEVYFHYRVRKGFQEIAQRYPDRVKLIDANKPIELVHKLILARVEPLLRETPLLAKVKP
jgi:dTMP kinase